jgi:hypothetical protein
MEMHERQKDAGRKDRKIKMRFDRDTALHAKKAETRTRTPVAAGLALWRRSAERTCPLISGQIRFRLILVFSGSLVAVWRTGQGKEL